MTHPGRPAPSRCTATPADRSPSGSADLLGRMTRREGGQLGSAWVFQLATGDQLTPGAADAAGATDSDRSRASPGASNVAAPAATRRQRDPAPPRRAHPPRHPGDRPRGGVRRADRARGHRVPAADRPRQHVAPVLVGRWPTSCAPRCGRSAPTRVCRRCSTSAAIRGGAGSRRRSARIRTSSPRWAWRSCAACRARHSTAGSWRRPSTSSVTEPRRAGSTGHRRSSPPASCARSSSTRSRPPCASAGSARS